MSELQVLLLGVLVFLGGSIIVLLVMMCRRWLAEMAVSAGVSAGMILVVGGAVTALTAYYILLL